MAIRDIPAFVNKDTDNKAEDYLNTGVSRTDQAGDKAISNTEKQADKVYNKNKSELDPNHGKNIAKGKGTYDMYNNRDYSTTLRLAREADAYNAKPREHIYEQNHWKAGGTQDLGTGFDKPELKTMEMRAMDQALELDTNQKKLAQALQDAANRQDLEAFQTAWKQAYGIELDKMEAEMEMSKLLRQMQMQQLFSKDRSAWSKYFERAFGLETADYIMSRVKTDPLYAAMYAQVLGGWAAPNQVEYIAQDTIDHLMSEYSGQGMSDLDSFLKAEQKVQITFGLNDTEMSKITQKYNGPIAGHDARKAGADTFNEVKNERYK